jgi:diadenylate cyclase
MPFIEVFWRQLTWKDTADILVVAFLIYQVLFIIRGTRAVQMLIGVGLMLALFWMGHSWGLHSVNWIMERFFNSFFIIAVILFQDQFRQALANFGRGRALLRPFGGAKTDEGFEIDEVVDACQALSQERVGALIVFERTHGLMNFITSGTPLWARVHSDLIYAIFQSRSPLHDGAIIISQGKVAAAGCFLPLSDDVEIERHLGTRHRAAVGITEDSDAIAVTVSEETGRVNICFQGTFYLCDSPRELRQYLRHLWSNEKLDERLRPITAKGIDA